MKVGKTSFAAQLDKNLILATELGTNGLDNLSVVPIMKWVDVKNVLKQLRDPRAREMYDTITFDTISIAADLVEKFICQRESVDSIRDVPYGQGWKMVAKELQETLREITMLGFGLILICHSKEKASNYTDEDGNPISSVEPDLSKNVYTVANAICDLIAYINVEFDKDGNSHRYLYTRQTPTIFAGSRWKYLAPKIEFGYQELVDAIGEAIEKQIPNKPIFSHNLSDTLSVFHCECGNTIKVSHDAGIMNNNNAANYCSKCGCRLDWSDAE